MNVCDPRVVFFVTVHRKLALAMSKDSDVAASVSLRDVIDLVGSDSDSDSEPGETPTPDHSDRENLLKLRASAMVVVVLEGLKPYSTDKLVDGLHPMKLIAKVRRARDGHCCCGPAMHVVVS